MQLVMFPDAIASQELELFRADCVVRAAQSRYDRELAAVEHAIAFDPELKNDAQRKARRVELMSQPAVSIAFDALQSAIDDKTTIAIQLRLIENQFAVAKLSARREIAQLEARI